MAKRTPFKSVNQDSVGNTVVVEGAVTIYDKPTARIEMDPPGPWHSGDKITFRVAATWDEEIGGTSSLFVDGKEVPLNADNEYDWTAP